MALYISVFIKSDCAPAVHLFFKCCRSFHFFHPATLEDAFGPKRQPRRNLELTRIDADCRMICQEFILRNHIRICLHHAAEDRILSTGEKHPVHHLSQVSSWLRMFPGYADYGNRTTRYHRCEEPEAIESEALIVSLVAKVALPKSVQGPRNKLVV
jgi:hypothetical protein